MALDPVKNFAKVEVSTGYDDAAVSVALATGDGAKLPDPATDGAFNLVWWNWTDYKDPADDPNREIVRCTARSSDTLTITRAQEGTSASNKNTSGKTYKMILALTSKMIADIQAEHQYTVASVTGTHNETATENENVLLADASGGAVTVNLPTAAGNTAVFHVKKTDSSSNTVTIDPSGSETIDGEATKVIENQHTVISLVSDGTNWRII